ncbi:N-myc-interactor [Apus apus]|uniref:N-myc-interactor n=1 Tax=Apus apus TaxID=8895 RepID=UPI0021F83FE9|nr:N-myc-interactor [Apus apus]XP_051479508.1 N-myc-interactor [Apus apus]
MDFTGPPLPLQDNGFKTTTPEASGIPEDEMASLEEELRIWKERVEKAEKEKAALACQLNAEEGCAKAEEDLIKLDVEEEQQKDMMMPRDAYERELSELNQENTELQRELEKLKEEIAEWTSELSQHRQIKKKVAEVKMKFTHMEDMQDDYADMNIHCVFGVATKSPFKLKKNEALLTFEDEEVAQRLIEMGEHTVDLDNKKADVGVKPVTLEMGVKFQLHVTISGTKINVSEVPDLSIPDDWMRDKLELNFYRSKQGGGGEVENVQYDKQSRAAVITFLTPGAANSFVRCTHYPFYANGRCYRLAVSQSTDAHLEQFQLYRGISKRTILLKGIKDAEDDEEIVQDMIEIHFQKPTNGGGEVDEIKYSPGGTWVYLEEDI